MEVRSLRLKIKGTRIALVDSDTDNVEGYATEKSISPYLAPMAIFAVGFTAVRCKISKKRR